MSALGQNRTLDGRLGHVRFTPQSGHAAAGIAMSALCHKQTLALNLLDHLVGAGEPRRWYVQAEHLGGF